MVFETLVADLLNRFLGDYVDNLDASQLNIGIWGGDVKLNNLEVKETALDELDLPIKLKFGFLSNLVLKIPWKNLYTEPVIADIEGLYLIVVPNKGVVYNEAKTAKNDYEQKQKALARLEENRKNRRKPKDPSADSFAEKMVAQVIKNLQVQIKNIHIRFEDRYTNRHRPFVAGLTLESLNFQTTDENWKATILKDTVKIFHKLISMQNLAVYWNSDAKLISDLTDRDEIKAALKATIATQSAQPDGFKYILQPITMEAKLALNQKPESDGSNWTIPKIDLNVGMEQLALCIGRFQYQDILLFLEAQERFNLATRYLKYRPNLVEYRGSYKQWWKFAIDCVLEENIRRKKRNWSWKRMKDHRQLVRDYRDAWVLKQTEKTINAKTTAVIEAAEKQLDVFNLNVARHQAEADIDRKGLTRLEDQPQGWGAWAKSWWGSGSKGPEQAKTAKTPDDDILGKFQQEMTPEEKQKLFEAIDYQENTPPTDYPKHYVENKIAVNLSTLAVIVEEALELKFNLLSANVEQRPSARAIHIKSAIKALEMTGCGQPMIKMLQPSTNWLDLEVETNPIKGDFDQFVSLGIKPVLMYYHAPAVNTAIDVFKPPESVRLNQLTAAALARYEDVKAQSVTGLQHAVDKKSKLKLQIKIEPATIVITESGVFAEEKPNLIAELGVLTIETTDEASDEAYQDISDARHRKVVMAAYDKFQIRLSNIQLIFAEDFSKAMGARSVKESPYHVLKPTGLDVGIHKCSIDDLNMPKLRVFGDLPDIVIHISDARLIALMKLGLSIPAPPSSPEEQTTVDLAAPVKLRDRAKMLAIMEVDEIEDDTVDKTQESEEKDVDAGDSRRSPEDNKRIREQQVQIDVNLRLNQIGVLVLSGEEPVINVNLRRFGMQYQMRTFDMVVKMHLGSLTLEQPQFRDLYDAKKTLFLIDNPQAEGEHLISMTFIQANEESPFFTTVYKNTKQTIDFEFKQLNMILHQDALVEIKSFGTRLSQEMAAVQNKDPDRVNVVDGFDQVQRQLSRQISESIASIGSNGSRTAAGKAKIVRKPRKGKNVPELDVSRIIDMQLNARVHSLNIVIGTKTGADTSLAIKDVTSEVTMRSKLMEVTAALRAIEMLDQTPTAVHRHLLAVSGDQQMFQMHFKQFNRTDEEKKAMTLNDVDMSVKIRFAQLRFVFLNLWVNRMLNWISPFQVEAAQAAAQAQALAAAQAAETAANVKQIMVEAPPRLQLDIELAAPAIVVPRLSTSNDVLLVDLGRLQLKNGFNKSGAALIDELTIGLKDMHMGVGQLDPSRADKVSTSCQLLKPMSFTLSVFRNLNFAQIKTLPELTVKAYLPIIDVSMTQNDYALIMHTLAGNLAEGTPPTPAAAPVTSPKPKDRVGDANEDPPLPKKSTATTPTDKKKKAEAGDTADGSASPVPPTAAKRIVFKFVMDNITAGLYSGSSGLVPGKGTVERTSANAFAAMKLKDLLVSGFMTEDGGLDVAIMLDSFAMSDEREGKTQIRKLMDKKPGKESDRFVQMKFVQNSRGDKDIVLTSTAFFLFLCPEFLGQLSSFFVVPQAPEEANIPPEVLAKRKQQAALNAPNTTAGPAVNAAPGTTKPSTEPQAAAGALAIKGAINDIEVILIENSLQPKTSQALILSLSMVLDGDTQNGKQKINGEVKDLQIVSTYFEPSMRNLAHYDVLKKLSIALDVEIDQETQGQVVAVKMDDVHLKVSPAVIRLLSAVGQQFSEHRVENNQNDDEKPVLLKYPGYYNKTKIIPQQFWWFNNCVEEALEGGFGETVAPTVAKVEEASFTIDSFVITLEAGSDEDTIPMILVEASLKAVAKDWSSKLSCDAVNELQISYYNEAFSVWEPVIEPVLSETDDGKSYWNPWTVKMSIRTNTDDVIRDAVYDAGEEEEALTPSQLPPKMQVNIDATEALNVTITKSFLKLLTQLGAAFERAAKQASPPKSRSLPGTSPYLILNDTGLTVHVTNSDSMKVSESGDPIDATHSDFVELNVVGWEQKVGLSHTDDNRKAELCLELLETQREVSVLRADTHSVRLPRHAPSGRQWVMVVDTSIESSRRIVNLKSLVSFVNHTSMPLEIHSLRDTNLDLCGKVENDGDALNVPVPLLYTATGEFFFRPSNEQFDMSNEGVSWHEFEHEKRATIRCDCTADTSEGVFFDLVALEEPVLGEFGTTAVDRQWTVHIYPPMVFRNCLPFSVNVSTSNTEGLTALEGGEDVPVNLIAGQILTVKLEYEESYTAHFDIRGDRGDLEIITFVADNDLTKELYLGIHWSTKHHRQDCQLYAPYWLVNNTNKELRYLESLSTGIIPSSSSSCVCRRRRTSSKPEFCVCHAPGRNPVLLPFADKGIASKKKARVRVGNSGWSDEFPLDAAGSAARVTCKDNGHEYELTVDTQVCQSGLTKVLSFSPFYLLYNDSKFNLEVKEDGENEWIHAPAASCTALWPKQKSKRKLIQARYADTKEASLPFPFTENFEAFCPIDSDLLGIYATCSVGESSSIVHVEPFEPGMCPAILMNATDIPIEYCQKGQSERHVLPPNEQVPFRWRDMDGNGRKLEWTCGEYAAEEELARNAYGSFLATRQTGYWYWVSFLHGRQRYFVFTDDLAVMTTAQQTYESERMDMATEVNFQGIGISIVNNLLSQEILFMGISCSGILWEKRVKTDRYKAFAVKDIEAIEAAYQKWITEGSPTGKSQITLSGNGIAIDFSRKILYRKGKKSELALRRNYANGLWLLFRQSAHQKQVHLKLNHVQIDNQLPACVFPCVLAVVPPPKSVVADNAPKPFTELAMIMQQPEHSSIVQYKYLHVLIQEFAVRVDQGLINSLIEMFATEQGTAPYNREMFQKDLELTKPHLQEKAVTTAASQLKAFYDDLHISPLMIHLSFSQGGTPAGQTGPQTPRSPDEKNGKNGDSGGINIQSEFINVLLKSVGVSLTELQDVVFKLAFFERRAQFYSMPQLQAEIQSHYTMQFIKQLYVLVLGLDIIGNPFGLVRDLSSGVEDFFYQPFQGAIQGPEEFVDGLALGVTSLLGHAVGGAAGAVSRITGTLGKGVAALTLDEDYQRKRQEAINRRPQNFGEGISRGAKGLGQGFYDGVTGIVTKPIDGMKTGGFGGLVKGVGKGLVGAVTRPVSGVVDFASSSLDAVKTVAGTSHEAKSLRPSRVILQDQIVRPYNFPEAIGYKFFRDTEHGKFANTDHYVAHALISDKIVFIVTDKRVFLARRQDIFGTWVADWSLEYDDINTIKTTDSGGIAFELKQRKKGFLGFGGTRGKLVELRNKFTAEHIAERALAAHNQTL